MPGVHQGCPVCGQPATEVGDPLCPACRESQQRLLKLFNRQVLEVIKQSKAEPEVAIQRVADIWSAHEFDDRTGWLYVAVHSFQADIYSDHGRYADAVRIRREMLARRLDPEEELFARTNLGSDLARMTRMDEAAEELERAALEAPDTLDAKVFNLFVRWARLTSEIPLKPELLQKAIRALRAEGFAYDPAVALADQFLECDRVRRIQGRPGYVFYPGPY